MKVIRNKSLYFEILSKLLNEKKKEEENENIAITNNVKEKNDAILTNGDAVKSRETQSCSTKVHTGCPDLSITDQISYLCRYCVTSGETTLCGD